MSILLDQSNDLSYIGRNMRCRAGKVENHLLAIHKAFKIVHLLQEEVHNMTFIVKLCF